jgi:hypothetical protein
MLINKIKINTGQRIIGKFSAKIFILSEPTFPIKYLASIYMSQECLLSQDVILYKNVY